MWVNVDEDKYVNDTLFPAIRKNFASKVAPSRQPIHDLDDKSKELRVLDPKAAQNFGRQKQKYLIQKLFSFSSRSAIMFSQLKISPFVLREWMLSCDNDNFKDDFLKQLEKYLPTTDELRTLAEYRNEINDLQYSEQYFCAVKKFVFVLKKLNEKFFPIE